MAIYSLGDLTASMPQLFMELRPQMQRKCPLLSVLAIKASNTGKNIGWVASFDGQSAAVVNPDGGPLVTSTADPRLPATLGYGAVGAAIRVTSEAQATANAYGNVPDFLNNMIQAELIEAINKMLKIINQQLYSGNGTANALTGLSLAVASSGTYATIPVSGISTNWASTQQGNAGALRSLTLALIKTMLSTVATVSPVGRPDIAVCTPAVFNTLENLFDGTIYTQAGKNDLQWGQVMTNAGNITARGFRTLAWMSAGVTFVEDPDCVCTAQTNTANAIYFLNSQSVEIRTIPPAPIPGFAPDQRVVQAVEQAIGGLANLQIDFRARGRTTYSDEFDTLAMLNLVVKDRAACGLLFDVQ